MAHMEHTFIGFKPDGVQRCLVGKITKRFEEKGFCLVAMKFLQASEKLLKQPYIDLKDCPFFPGAGEVHEIRASYGCGLGGPERSEDKANDAWETNPADSKPGTVHGDFCIQVDRNIIHGSDSVKSAEKEISPRFKPKELIEYKSFAFDWIYE